MRSTLFLLVFSAPLLAQATPLERLTRPIPGRPMRASSGLFDPESNRDAHHVQPGQRFLLADLKGPGEIRHIWFTIASRDRRYPRSLVLRCYWDGAPIPSVETPIGDFFAAGNGMRAPVCSAPIEVTSYGRALNSYWRMPFRRSARIEVENQGKERTTVYFQCDWLQTPVPDDALYFHARYRQEYPAKPFSTYTVIEIEGRGHYVGTVLSSQNNLGSWFGESDDRFWIDGEQEPSIIGTGLEDYFNDAWNLRLFTQPRRGVTICETKGDERRITAYRWHTDDPIPFQKSLKLEIERRSYAYVDDPKTGKRTTYDFKYRPDDFSSVAYWYHDGIAPLRESLPPVEARIPHEVWVEVTDLADGVAAAPGLRPRQASNRTCNLKRFFYLRNDAPGGWVEFPVEITERGRYTISVFQSLFRQYGVWRVRLLGDDTDVVLDPALDFFDDLLARNENWPENWHHGTLVETKVGIRTLVPGRYRVRFECVGSNPQSLHPETREFGKGYSLGLDAILFRKLRIEEPAAWMAEYLDQEQRLFAERVATAEDWIAATAARIDAGTQAPTGALPLDPWGQAYRFRRPGEINPWSFDLWSVHGEERDPRKWIGNWPRPYRVPNGIEGEELLLKEASDGVSVQRQRLTSDGVAPLSAGAILFVRARRPGDHATLTLPAVPAGKYAVHLFLATSWDYGIQQWSLNDQPLGRRFDAWSQTIGRRALPATVVQLTGAPAVLRVDIVGRNERSTGCLVGLDGLRLVPAE